MSTEKQPSPLDELARPVDDFWEKIAPGYVLTDEQVAELVIRERELRESWMAKSAKKKLKREEKENDG